MSKAEKRLIREFQRIQKDPPEGCAVSPDENNIFRWTGILFGVEETIWEGANLKFVIEYPQEYPQVAPKIFFTPPIFHPNVHVDQNNYGRVSMDIIKTNWSAVIDTWTILISMRSLLTDPNPQVYANKEAHVMYFQNKQQYDDKIREFIKNYKLPEEEDDDDNEVKQNQEQQDQQQDQKIQNEDQNQDQDQNQNQEQK